jgi:hypothetical protein
MNPLQRIHGMAADAFDEVFKGKGWVLMLQPRLSPWATEARRLSELLAHPREPEAAKPRPFEDLDSVWRDEETPRSW